jgi:uncharacterized protein YbjT (DUF2867 family)
VAGLLFPVLSDAGVRHVAFVSSGTIDLQPPVTIGRWHLEGEAALKATGMAWTMLRPGAFASNALRWAGSIKAQGAVFAPNAQGRAVPVDPRDIAAVGAAALLHDGHAGRTYTVTGPAVVTPAQQVELIGAALGRPLRFVEVSAEQAREGMLKAGMPPAAVEPVLELMAVDRHEAPVTSVVKDVTGHEPRTFADWVRDNVAAFK